MHYWDCLQLPEEYGRRGRSPLTSPFRNERPDDSRRQSNTVTMRDVAQLANVALSSVSRVLNDHPDVSGAMRSRVNAAIDELGYEPDLVASSLRRGTTKTVGFMVADISNPLFAEMLRGTEKVLRAEGYVALLAHSQAVPERDAENIRLLSRRRVDGLILSIADETRRETLDELARRDLPIVLLDRDATVQPNASSVVADHERGTRRATDHLLDHGHQRIALITGDERIQPTRQRLDGFRSSFVRRGLPSPEDLIHLGSFSEDFGLRVMTDVLNMQDPPTAVISGGNQLLAGVLAAMYQRNLNIPGDVSIIACDDTSLARLHRPPITVVTRDAEAMGAIAAKLLLERLDPDDPAPARTQSVPTELIVRESTARRR